MADEVERAYRVLVKSDHSIEMFRGTKENCEDWISRLPQMSQTNYDIVSC